MLFLSVPFSLSAAELRLTHTPSGFTAESRAAPPAVAGAAAKYHIEVSHDLQKWRRIEGDDLKAVDADERLQWELPSLEPWSFFRLGTKSELLPVQNAGEEVLGYGGMLRKSLRDTGFITVEQFNERFPVPKGYLRGISWDVTTAQFWPEFNTDPIAYNSQLPPENLEKRLTDFRLNAAEMALFRKNGFVVSERMGAHSFAEIYYRIYTDDLPVFVSIDSVLQAWHRSYLSMLEEIERTLLQKHLETIVNSMLAKVPELWAEYGQTELRDSILDADYFLTVAKSLLEGGERQPQLDQVERVRATLTLINAESGRAEVSICGEPREIDFSQFKPRGHYENSPRYFKAMIWCGRIDFRLGTEEPEPSGAALRQLTSAAVLHELLQRSGSFPLWKDFDDVIRNLVGLADSMNFAQMGAFLQSAGIDSLQKLDTPAEQQTAYESLLATLYGLQEIAGDLYYSPWDNSKQLKLPRSFTFMGQRFAPDSWALSHLVYDSILWPNANGQPQKIHRRIPSALDVVFTILGNNAAVPILGQRIENASGTPFRDGLPYQHQLAALRSVIDAQSAASWNSSIYMKWLSVLRKLSRPTTENIYPEAIRTEAWAMKDLNTQLASWTHLRHDNLLYVKQSYTRSILCSYPAGYVEPRPEVWNELAELAELAHRTIQTLPAASESIQQSQLSFWQSFAGTVRKLKALSDKELASAPFSADEEAFMNDLIELKLAYGGERQYSGWYPALFYRNSTTPEFDFHTLHGSDKFDALVADVHTDPAEPMVGDPGAILHQAVGNVNLLMIAVDNGVDRMIYAGPLLSHYEFTTPWPQRRSDGEWRLMVANKQQPPQPEWTQSYLVPGPITLPPDILQEIREAK